MMLANILVNAVQYSHLASTVAVSSGRLADGSAQVQIADWGIVGDFQEVVSEMISQLQRATG